MFDKRLMALCPESKKYIAGNIILQWLELFLNAVMIGLIALSAEKLYRGELTPRGAVPSLVIIAVTILIRFFVTRFAVRMSYLASRTVKRKLRDLIYKKLLKLGMSYREKVTTAEIVQESVEGVDQLESYFGQYVPQFFYAFIAPVTLFILFAAAGSWQTGLVLLLFVPLIPGTIMMVQKIAKKILAKYWGQYTQLGSTFLENLQGMTTLKIYQADEFKNEQMNKESEHFRVVTMKVLTMQLNSIIIMDLLAYGGTAVGIVLATRSFAEGTLGLARCLFMILLSADFFLPMRKLGSYFHVAMNGMAASDRIFRFLELEEPAELMLISTHPDDEILWFGGILPYYAGELRRKVEVVYMVGGLNPVRTLELLDGLWYMGVTHYPDIGTFSNVGLGSLSSVYDGWGRYGADERIVEVIRHYRPQVVITQDVNGEYLHYAHVATVQAVIDVFENGLSADEGKYPESAAAWGTWEPLKLYIHLWKENEIRFDWNRPLDAFGGKTGLQIAKAAFKKHVSQQNSKYHHAVKDSGQFDCSRFGLYWSSVGPDEAHDDLFEHVPTQE